MKKLTWLVAAALVAAFAIPALAGSSAGHKAGKCSEDAQACLNHMSAKKDMGWMGVEFDKSAEGVKSVKAVGKDSPAEKAGFLVGDVLVARNGIKLADLATQKSDPASYKTGAKVSYTVLRAGAEKELAIVLAPMPEEAFAKMVGAHMISDHMVVATAAATETATPAKAATETATPAKAASTDK